MKLQVDMKDIQKKYIKRKHECETSGPRRRVNNQQPSMAIAHRVKIIRVSSFHRRIQLLYCLATECIVTNSSELITVQKNLNDKIRSLQRKPCVCLGNAENCSLDLH